jgi:hypothetical protein
MFTRIDRPPGMRSTFDTDSSFTATHLVARFLTHFPLSCLA